MSKIWFITGSSRGFGRVWADAALKRGDKVAATARNLETIADLKEKYGENALTLEMDVTNAYQVKAAVTQAHEYFGRLDVIVNNAGYPLIGTIEEASAAEVRALYDTNIFGTLAVIQAALPLLRQQGGGHIVGVSSTLGHVTMPLIGYYCSSKWAFEAIHESLALEVKPFGISDDRRAGCPSVEVRSKKALRTKGLPAREEFRRYLSEHCLPGKRQGSSPSSGLCNRGRDMAKSLVVLCSLVQPA